MLYMSNFENLKPLSQEVLEDLNKIGTVVNNGLNIYDTKVQKIVVGYKTDVELNNGDFVEIKLEPPRFGPDSYPDEWNITHSYKQGDYTYYRTISSVKPDEIVKEIKSFEREVW